MNIKIFDSSRTFKGIIDNAESCFKILIHGNMSSASITIGSSKNNADMLTKGSFFYVDDDKKHPFIITEDPKSFDRNGKKTSIVAYDVFWIFGGRLSNTGTSALTYSSKSVEYIIKDLIDKAIINATDTDRQISYIETAANQDRGSTINATINQTQLDTDIKSLLAIDSLGIQGEYSSTTKKITIDVYEGADRSVGNTDGNKPVNFDVKYNNVRSGEEKESITNVKNYAYILGQDTDGTRVIEEYGTATGINRREFAVDAGNTSDTTEMQAVGKAAVVTTEKSFTVTADALNGPFEYNVDYFRGDIVTVTGYDLRLLQVDEVWEAGKPYQLYLTFGQLETKIEDQVTSNTARINALETKVIGVGDVSGPASATAGNFAALDATGKILSDSGIAYAEGDWTPSIGGTVSYTVQWGHFIKIGKKVDVWFRITINAVTTSPAGSLIVTGSPYNTASATNARFIGKAFLIGVNWGTGETQVNSYISNGNGSIIFQGSQNNGANYTILGSDIANGDQLFGHITYFTD